MSARAPFGPSTAIGFVGVGLMGSGMAANLLKKGHRLQVFARRDDATTPLEQAGAKRAPSIAALGAACELVFVCVSDDAAVEAVLFGADGLAGAMRAGSVVVDASTIASTSAREFGKRLREKGIEYLDAPVSGGQQGAVDGTLGCMVGGDTDVVQACRPVMQAFCKTITHVGPSGAGQTVKSCNQVAVAAAMLGVADAIALAAKQGVDPAVMRDVILGGTGKSVPMERMAPRVIAGDFKPGFRARLMRKDLRIAVASAKAAGVELAAAPAALEVLEALCAGGREEWDWCAIALEVQRRSGMDIPKSPAGS